MMRKVLLGLLVFVAFQCTVWAQSSTNVNQDVSGYRDKDGKNPKLSVTVEHHTGSVRIIAQGEVTHGDYAAYPLRYEFYVNRKLFSTQMQANELPGPVSIDVTSKDASLPFNYTVLVTLIHPNRQYMTTQYGAVFSENLNSTFDCSLTLAAEDDSTKLYTASGVETNQTGNSSSSLSFEAANSEDEDEKAQVTVSLNISSSSSEASGSVSYTIDGTPTTVTVEGEAVFTDDRLTSISVETEDGEAALSCL